MRVAAPATLNSPVRPLAVRSVDGPRLIASLAGFRFNASVHSAISGHAIQHRCPALLQHRISRVCHTKHRPSLQKCGAKPTEGAETDEPSILPSIGLFVFWIGITGYAFLLSPNQTSLTDGETIQRITGILKDDVTPNAIFSAIFTLIGVYIILYTGLLIPSGRSKNKVPAWPFILVSLAFGSYALMPYFALWQPDTEITGPPKKADLEGWKALPQSVLESRLLWVLGLLYTLYTSRLLIADGGVYGEYFELLFKSRAVHATTIDTILLYAFTPFWMSNDATVRGWKGSQGLLLFLSFVPLIGPLVYMILRPRDE